MGGAEEVGGYAVDRRIALSRKWDRIVAAVRELGSSRGIPELADFLQPPKAALLADAGREGAVVVVNVSRTRCDALLIADGRVRSLPLPGVTAEGVEARTVAYLVALRTLELVTWELHEAMAMFAEGGRAPEVFFRVSGVRAALAAVRTRAEEELAGLTAWLWDEICGPVLDALGHTGAPACTAPLPRVWWCPTGLLNLLPLHAAGHHDEPVGDRPRTVLDRVVSSYTPTVRTLLAARSRSAPTAEGDGRMLFVAPEPAGLPVLESIADDRAVLAGLFGERLTPLEGPQASAASVLEALRHHRWVHFSTHAGQNLDDPGLGVIALHDDALTVHRLAAGSYRGELAFLSACQTAVGGIDLANEAITLCAALHVAGFRHVIGTLWSVQDRAAATVTREFYGAAGTDTATGPAFDSSAAAHHLHRAVRALREQRPGQLTAWVPFVHIGP